MTLKIFGLMQKTNLQPIKLKQQKWRAEQSLLNQPLKLICPSDQRSQIRLQLHGAIYRPDSFVSMLRYCANLKTIRYESTSLNRIVADKSHRVIVALDWQ